MVYDYECQYCQYHFERSLPVSEMLKPEKTPCPECGKKKVLKLLTYPKDGTGRVAGISSGRSNLKSHVPMYFRDRLKEIKRKAGKHSTINTMSSSN